MPKGLDEPMSTVQREWYDRYMMPNYAPAAMIPVRGSGSRMWDQEDREYIDFGGGIAVNAQELSADYADRGVELVEGFLHILEGRPFSMRSAGGKAEEQSASASACSAGSARPGKPKSNDSKAR